MNRFQLTMCWVIAVFVVFSNDITIADGIQLAQNDERPHFHQGMKGKPGERFDKFRREKLTELLELSEDQKENFLPMWQEQVQNLKDLRKQQRTEMNYLASLLRDHSLSEQEADSLVTSLIALSNRRHQERNLLIQKARDFLTPVQVGKLLVFEERFESHVMNKLKRDRGPEGRRRDHPGERRHRNGP